MTPPLRNLIPPLLNILQNADFKTKKEACWAISNATSGGLQEPNQIRYLVTQGCIKPMCDLLQSMDNKIIQVALDGLENILKVGEIDKEAGGPGAVNQYAQYIEEAGGMVSIHNLQHHENLEIYKKCFYLMDSESALRRWRTLSYWLLQSSSPTKMRRKPRVLLQPSMHPANMPSSRTVRTPRLLERISISFYFLTQLRCLKAALTSATSASRHHSPCPNCVNDRFLLVEYSSKGSYQYPIFGRSHRGPRIVVPAFPIPLRPLAILSFRIPAIRSRGQSAESPSTTFPQHRLYARVVSSASILRLLAGVLTRLLFLFISSFGLHPSCPSSVLWTGIL